MSAFYTSGDFAVKSATGKPRRSYPIPGVTAAYVLDQDYIQLFANYTANTLNSAHPDNANAYLVQIGPLSDLGAGVARWTETYAAKPPDHSEYETFAYRFIGFSGVLTPNGVDPTGREPFTRTVLSRLEHKYYRIFSVGGDYTSVSQIPLLSEQEYVWADYTTIQTNYIGDAPPFDYATSPDRTTYDGWVANGTEFCVEGSRLSRWMGNIWMRQTRYVVAI